MDALLSALDLKQEQDRLEMEKRDLDARLNNVTDAAEKQRLLAEKAAVDAQISENAGKQTRKRGKLKEPSVRDLLDTL